MIELLRTVWSVIVNNKEIMAGILGIQVLVTIIIIVMLAIDEDEPMIRQ